MFSMLFCSKKESVENSTTEKFIEINDELNIKYGLKKSDRMKVWTESYKAELKATEEAEKKYPVNYNSKSKNWKEVLSKQMELQRKLDKKYQAEVEEKYNITSEQSIEISVEAMENNWPIP